VTPEQYFALARMSKATVYTNRHYPLRPAVSFSHEAWLEFCKKLDELVQKSQSVVNDVPVAEVIESHVMPGLNGMCTAEVQSRERLSVGAELFIHPQPAQQPLTGEEIGALCVRHGLSGACIHAFARDIERAATSRKSNDRQDNRR
jgi:hypothetical protein